MIPCIFRARNLHYRHILYSLENILCKKFFKNDPHLSTPKVNTASKYKQFTKDKINIDSMVLSLFK